MPLTPQLFVGLKCRFDDAPAVGLISFRCCIFVIASAVSTSAMEWNHLIISSPTWRFVWRFVILTFWFFRLKIDCKILDTFLKSESLSFYNVQYTVYTDSNFSSWVLYGAPVQSSYSLSVYTTARTLLSSVALCNTCFHFPFSSHVHLASINLSITISYMVPSTTNFPHLHTFLSSWWPRTNLLSRGWSETCASPQSPTIRWGWWRYFLTDGWTVSHWEWLLQAKVPSPLITMMALHNAWGPEDIFNMKHVKSKVNHARCFLSSSQ